MENYLVSARKYRPATFDTVVGQQALTATLKNAIATGRLAHSYLFCGSRGVGKTSCARIFAKTINCLNPGPDGEACNECDSCRSFNNGSSLNIIELDAASNNGVADMHGLIEQVMVPPTVGRYRVFIIDEVHMLSNAAFNAFLKTLEEPPEYVVFILATTEKHKILPTILSRCQIYDFKRIGIADMVAHLDMVARREGMTAEPQALNVIARKADGAMRDALSIFDQVAASTRGNITYRATIENLNVLDNGYYDRLLDDFIAGNVLDTWLIYKDIRDHGHDSHFFINGLADYMRDLMVARDASTAVLLEATDEVKQSMARRAASCSPDFLLRAMDLLNEADLNYKTVANKQFLVELTLARLCQSLSPSPNKGHGEGQLQPIARPDQPMPAAQLATPPQPQPQPQPGREPAAAASPARPQPAPTPAAPRPHATLKRPLGPSLSINPTRAAQQRVASPSGSAQPAARRETPYAPEALEAAWQAYIDANPHAHILANTMRASHPVRVDNAAHHYQMTVENEMQRSTMLNAMPALLTHLHNALANDLVSVDVLINEGESSPHTWNERDLLAHMVNEYPALRDLVTTLKLKL